MSDFSITVRLDDSMIAGAALRAANDALAELFSAPKYDRQDRGGAAYEIVRNQTREILETIDVRSAIRDEAQKLAQGIVRDLVGQELRRRVKVAIKQELEDGTLFPEPKR